MRMLNGGVYYKTPHIRLWLYSLCQNNLFLCLVWGCWCHATRHFIKEKIYLSSPGWRSHWKWMNHISWWHLWVFIRKIILWWETQVHHGCCCCSTTLQELLARKHGSGGRWQKLSRKNKMRVWQFNWKAVLDGASDELHSLPVCLSLCKCHRQSGNARLLCFSGCLVSCCRTKGGISINNVLMSITHVTWQHKQGQSHCRHMSLNTWRRIEPRSRLFYCTQLQC